MRSNRNEAGDGSGGAADSPARSSSACDAGMLLKELAGDPILDKRVLQGGTQWIP